MASTNCFVTTLVQILLPAYGEAAVFDPRYAPVIPCIDLRGSRTGIPLALRALSGSGSWKHDVVLPKLSARGRLSGPALAFRLGLHALPVPCHAMRGTRVPRARYHRSCKRLRS